MDSCWERLVVREDEPGSDFVMVNINTVVEKLHLLSSLCGEGRLRAC